MVGKIKLLFFSVPSSHSIYKAETKLFQNLSEAILSVSLQDAQ